jgi:hypothetical protein
MSFMIQIQMNLSAPNRSLLSGVLVRLPILLGMTCVALRSVIAQEAVACISGDVTRRAKRRQRRAG